MEVEAWLVRVWSIPFLDAQAIETAGFSHVRAFYGCDPAGWGQLGFGWSHETMQKCQVACRQIREEYRLHRIPVASLDDRLGPLCQRPAWRPGPRRQTLRERQPEPGREHADEEGVGLCSDGVHLSVKCERYVAAEVIRFLK